MNRAVVIGAGLGGLECGVLLQKHGYKVTVLEHDTHIGGYLQSYHRGSAYFDAGFHYIGSFGEGEPLNRMFKALGLTDLPWHKLDGNCADKIVIGNRQYPIPQGYDRLADTLCSLFPDDKEGIIAITNIIREVSKHLFDNLIYDDVSRSKFMELMSVSAYDFLRQNIRNERLFQLLSAVSTRTELRKDSTPLYVWAQQFGSFVQSAYRIEGGGMQIANRLKEQIEQSDGQVLTNSTVTKINEQGGRIVSVCVNDKETVPLDLLVSAIQPAQTMALLDKQGSAIHGIYRKRIQSLPLTYGMFTANIRLKPNCVKYSNFNYVIAKENTDFWELKTDKVNVVLVSEYVPQNGSEYISQLDLLTPLTYEQIQPWENTRQGHRGESYVAFKQQLTEQCLTLAEQHIPNLRNAIDKVYTSTPLTYRHYANAERGNAFGTLKDFRSPLTTIISPKTAIPNLFLTGQHLCMHGILGVTATAFLTAKNILGKEVVLDDLELNK